MSLATLTQVLRPAQAEGTAVAGLVVQGWEDARAYVAAAEAEARPVILQIGPGARAHTPLEVLAPMLCHLARGAAVPVVLHLDHAPDLACCAEAIELGFTSVMYDGSALPLAENIARTAEIARLARDRGVSLEAELGFVGYAGGAASAPTEPDQAARFWDATGVDALAVSVGNTHLMTAPGAGLDMGRLRGVAKACPGLALVLHGGSGIAPRQRRALAAERLVAKFNIGTELRQAFGSALRQALQQEPALFDRLAILSRTEPAMRAAARQAIASLWRP